MRQNQYLQQAAREINVSYRILPSGAGHDCVQFPSSGIPSAMLFIRNQNGSHNPHEAIELRDFNDATAVLNKTLFKYVMQDNL
ncbi:M20/M25/M40 family metallo-hydrolase [Pantoea sp. BAV 3049]|uniref:M20/M25/M40 family metallo-hydrolase n=1 Tax=Pantoea sp. BAV 3049 TaxID=2654188 RepID=UPI0018EF04C2|nr:M20/M25/M40 family metallo-hydrolase [Pantoea sp. BAV 3049]